MARSTISANWPDLPAVKATYFSIGLDLEATALRTLFQRLGLAKKDRSTPFVQHYLKAGVKHEAYGHLHEAPTAEMWHLSFDLLPQSYPRGTPRFSRLFDELTKLESNVLGHCTATFEWSRDAVTPILRLPFKLLEFDGAPFDEIRGFRAVKLAADDEVLFSATIDSRGQDYLYSVIDFDYAGLFDERFVAHAFQRAVDYAGRVVKVRTED